ncbi:MAG: L-seryl-tRNA(Sec) selenium transferase [Armatimonadota bacterium]
MRNDLLRRLPSIDELMNTSEIIKLSEIHDRDLLVDSARTVVDDIRSAIISGDESYAPEDISAEQIAGQVSACIEEKFAPSIRYAVNAAGIILHTGLGRAMLSTDAVDAIHDVIRRYSTLATNIETGLRETRDIHFSDLLCELTGAESATVANNNAAATMLVLNTMAQGKEVIISRGQLVEIGGSFRMPDVMASSGAIMREVGTTNKTHLRDYESAINENTGAIIRVHHSNYRIIGFHQEPTIEELTELGVKHGIPVIDDLGSGALVDLRQYGLEPEPMVRESIAAGVDIACFSGDKLIGGPQCGIIVGKKDAVQKIKKNPLARAFRVGKMTVAGLEATLKLFLDPGRLNERHPTYRMLSLTLGELESRAQSMAGRLRESLRDVADVQVADDGTQVGSGSVPGEMLPTKVLCISPSAMSSDALARKLRKNATPIFTRIRQDAVLFDLRTVQPGEESIIEAALQAILTKEDPNK